MALATDGRRRGRAFHLRAHSCGERTASDQLVTFILTATRLVHRKPTQIRHANMESHLPGKKDDDPLSGAQVCLFGSAEAARPFTASAAALG